MEKIKNFLKNKFKKREKNKVLFNPAKKTFFKKRNKFSIKINVEKPANIIKKNYLIYLFFICFFLISVIIFIIFWPIFRVEVINITKKDSMTNIDIAYKSMEDFRFDSIFNMNKNIVLERLKDYQENIKNIDLNIDFPKTMNITVESYKQKFNIVINYKNYILLENWSLIPTIKPSENLKTLEIIKNIEKTKILDYKKIFNEKEIIKIEELEKKVLENIAGIEISALKYYEKEKELHIILNKFTRLIFSLTANPTIEEQIKNLAILDREKSPISWNDKVYIDLRIRWKIFFCSIYWQKWKEKENICKANLENIYWQL